MKKLFLLPLVALTLVGCDNSAKTEPGTSASKNNWIQLIDNEKEYDYFVVTYGTKYVEYKLSNYQTFEYRDRRDDNYMILDIKCALARSTGAEGVTEESTYIGQNVNYAIY